MIKSAAALSSQSLTQERTVHKKFPRMGTGMSSLFEGLCRSLHLDLSVQIQEHTDFNQE